MRELGAGIGRSCTGGDVIVLIGELGAGKTTLAQGIARGLGIVDAVTSPTFVIARVHPSPGPGPDFVHVDAYRLGSLAEMDDLDLDSDVDTSVVVVEWGEGLAEGLSPTRLDIRIMGPVTGEDETRSVEIVAHGDRWHGVLAAIGAEST